MNQELIRQAFKRLRETPTMFCMNEWMARREEPRMDAGRWKALVDDYNLGRTPPCGTICCLAGAILLASERPISAADISWQAQEAAGLTFRQARELFFLAEWPEGPAFLVARSNSHGERLEAARQAVLEILGFDPESGSEVNS